MKTIVVVKDRIGFWQCYAPILERHGHRVQLVDIWKRSERERTLGASFDAFLWHAKHTPQIKRLARRLIYYFDREVGIPTFPSWRSYWHYDDKVAQYLLFKRKGVPTPRTFVFFDRDDALQFTRRADYPLVYKSAHGAGSANVGILAGKGAAATYVKKAFGRGVRTFFRSERQTGYVMFQEFLPGNPGDYRLVCYGDSLICGFFRLNRAGKPFASGSGEFSTPDLPSDLLEFAADAQGKFGYDVMSYDILKSSSGWVVAEMSVVFGDLTHTIYNEAAGYQRDPVTGSWNRLHDAGDRHERLIRFVLRAWGFVDE